MSKRSSVYSGFLNLYKPECPGSQALLGPVKRATGTRRVGHAGTLDPFASGVLPVAVGRSTRLIDRLHTFPKTYVADVRLGVATTTGDPEGEVAERCPVPELSGERVETVLSRFTGEIEQVPPAYSAIRVGGRRAYELARAGESVDLKPRVVIVHALSLLSLGEDRFSIEVSCSTGTYVRSLGMDIACALGTVGYLTRLVRTRVGPFRLEDTVTLERVQDAASRLAMEEVLSPPDVVLADLQAVTLDSQEVDLVMRGAPVPVGSPPPEGTMVRAYTEDGGILALLESSGGSLQPRLLLK